MSSGERRLTCMNRLRRRSLDELVLDPVVTQRSVEVHGLAERGVGVPLAVEDEHRGADLRGIGDRAELVVAVRARNE
jgi:hypothetical protein